MRKYASGIDRGLLKLVEVRWVVLPQHRPRLSCGIYRTVGSGFEVRCSRSQDDLLKAEFAPDLNSARAIADRWESTVIARNGLIDGPDDLEAR
jgi:hypothetical protein